MERADVSGGDDTTHGEQHGGHHLDHTTRSLVGQRRDPSFGDHPPGKKRRHEQQHPSHSPLDQALPSFGEGHGGNKDMLLPPPPPPPPRHRDPFAGLSGPTHAQVTAAAEQAARRPMASHPHHLHHRPSPQAPPQPQNQLPPSGALHHQHPDAANGPDLAALVSGRRPPHVPPPRPPMTAPHGPADGATASVIGSSRVTPSSGASEDVLNMFGGVPPGAATIAANLTAMTTSVMRDDASDQGAQGVMQHRRQWEAAEETFRSMAWNQKEGTHSTESLKQTHRELKQTFSHLLTSLQGLKDMRILPPTAVVEAEAISKAVRQHQRHLALHEAMLEVTSIGDVHRANELARSGTLRLLDLAVEAQPFPCVMKKQQGKSSKSGSKQSRGGREHLVRVQLLCAPNLKISGREVSVSVEGPDAQPAVMSAPLSAAGQAEWRDMQFTRSTGKRKAFLTFSCIVEAQLPNSDVAFEQMLTSPRTHPFVVTTHESQFCAATGMLLKHEAFDVSDSIPWPRFANLLQLHYLRASRINVTTSADRPLSLADLAYIQQKHFATKAATQAATPTCFDNFWKWFDPVLHRLRFDKHTQDMWNKGYLFGFVSRAGAAALLKGYQSGTFLIRFSERTPGSFAFAYVTKTGVVKHYLMQKDKKLPDFVRSKKAFSKLLLASVEFSVLRMEDRVKGSMAKDGAFGDYYTITQEACDGYDDIVDEA